MQEEITVEILSGMLSESVVSRQLLEKRFRPRGGLHRVHHALLRPRLYDLCDASSIGC
jgi:hypothetical protein